MRRRRRTRRRGRRRQRRDENPPQSLFRFVLPFRGKRSVQVVRRRRGRDAGRRDERREASREVVRLRGGGRDLRVQRARRRRGGRVPPLPRVLALVSEQERRELGLEGRGDSRPAEARVVVEVRRVVRRRVPQRAARQREGRQRDTRAPHVARRAFVPSRAPEDESIPGRRARVEPDDVFCANAKRTRVCVFGSLDPRARASLPLPLEPPHDEASRPRGRAPIARRRRRAVRPPRCAPDARAGGRVPRVFRLRGVPRAVRRLGARRARERAGRPRRRRRTPPDPVARARVVHAPHAVRLPVQPGASARAISLPRYRTR
jgi:hypothetical protein